MTMLETKTIHCPKCQRPVVLNGQFLGLAEFKVRCAGCQTDLQVSIRPQISAQLADSQSAPNTGLNDALRQHQRAKTPGPNQQIPESGMKVVGYLYPEDQ